MKSVNEIAEIYLKAREEKQTENKAFSKVKEYLEDIYQQKGLSNLSESLLEITTICCVKAKDAEAFGKGYFGIISGGGDSFGDTEAMLFEKLVDRFPNSVKLAEMLADVYGEISNDTGNPLYAEKLDNLSKNNPALENAALQLVYSLVDSRYNKNITLGKYIQSIDKVREIYLHYPKTDFAQVYADGLRYLLYMQEEEDAVKTIFLLEDLLTTWQDVVMGSYLDALSKLTWKQDEGGCLQTIEKIERYIVNSSYRKDIVAMNLAYTLANYSLCVEGEEKNEVIEKIAELAIHWTPAQKMARELSEGTYPYAHKPAKAK